VGGTTPVANALTFAVDSTTTNQNGVYTTTRTGGYAPAAMVADKSLPANSAGIIFQSYDGTKGAQSILGYMPAGQVASGANFLAALYLEPTGTGTHLVRGVYYDGSLHVTDPAMEVAQPGWDYGIGHDGTNNFGIMKRLTGTTGNFTPVGNYSFGASQFTGALSVQASLEGAASASLNQPKY
jgi:hypothetical protein